MACKAKRRRGYRKQDWRLEYGLIQAMPQLRLALRIAGRETGQIAALRPDYQLLIEEVQALISLIITLGESLKVCGERPTVVAVLQQSGAVHELASTLQTQLQDLVDDVERDRLGEPVGAHAGIEARVRALTDDLFEALHAREHEPMDMAVLAAALAKAIELASRLVTIREALAMLAEPQDPRPRSSACGRWRSRSLTSVWRVTVGARQPSRA